jgi:hypothetical protein
LSEAEVPKITISYRRTDSGVVGRIRDRLIANYGDDAVYMDIDNIPFGSDFRQHIREAVSQSDILLVIIGPRWLAAPKNRPSRLHDETDFVRLEVETALQSDVPIVPVLIGTAAMPKSERLPESLKKLAFINGAPVSTGRDFHQHMDRLIRSLDGIVQTRIPSADRTVVSSDSIGTSSSGDMRQPSRDDDRILDGSIAAKDSLSLSVEHPSRQAAFAPEISPTLMIGEYVFEDLIEFIEDGSVIPVVGEELLEVRDGDAMIPLYGYLARRLAERLEISIDALPAPATLDAVVRHYLSTGGAPQEVYPKLRPILHQARLEPPQALLQLAAMDRFNLFVSLTLDSLLARAIDMVRFAGDSRTAELAYSPRNPADLPAPKDELRQPVVYHLFGKASPHPDYVLTEEDMLEFLHSMQSARVVDHLFDALRDNHLLFLGCNLSGWAIRLLLRIARGRSLSYPRIVMETLVGEGLHNDRELSSFLQQFSPRTKIISASAARFVAELAARIQARAKPMASLPEPRASPSEAKMTDGSIFISYAHEDYSAACRLRDFLEEEAGIDVWLDARHLEAGDDWGHQIRRNIKSCSYFMPLISAASRHRQVGYFLREWSLAAERAMDFAESVPFIIPVVIDDTPEDAESVPERFRRTQWTRLPGGVGNEDFRRRIIALVRDYRRRTHQ